VTGIKPNTIPNKRGSITGYLLEMTNYLSLS